MTGKKTAKKKVKKAKTRKPKPVGKLVVTREEMEACVAWAKSMQNGEGAENTQLECLFSKTGHAVRIHMEKQDKSPYATLEVPGRTPRLLDIPALVLLRLLTAAVGSITIGTAKAGLHYMQCSIPSGTKRGNISFYAINLAAHAPKGCQATFLNDKAEVSSDHRLTHYDLRRRNLEIKVRVPNKTTSKNKFVLEDALRYALRNYGNRRMATKAKLGFSTTDFEALLLQTVAALDALLLSEA